MEESVCNLLARTMFTIYYPAYKRYGKDVNDDDDVFEDLKWVGAVDVCCFLAPISGASVARECC